MTKFDYSIIVLGAGAGGLVVAIGAAKAGKRVLLIENGNYGGDCTNFGCIPSKSLIAAAHAAHTINTGAAYGLNYKVPPIDASGALERTRNIVAQVRSGEEEEALQHRGVDTLTGFASFMDLHTLEVKLCKGSTRTVTGKNIVIATGSRPRVPNIPGLKEVPCLDNECIFDLKDIPRHLAVIGGGPIGCELSSAFRRLGSQVSIIQHREHLLAREEFVTQQLIEGIFTDAGINLYLGYETIEAARKNGKIILTLKNVNTEELQNLTATHLLIAAGRIPNCDQLHLEAANVKANRRGIITDHYGRTSQKHIWAVGDVVGRALFTHIAENEGRTVLFNLLNPLPWPFKKKKDLCQAIPHVTFTDPEIGKAGLSEKEAIDMYGACRITTYHVPFTHVDRAITTGRTEGFVRIITKKWSSKILGTTVVGPRAGEMLTQITTAMHYGIPLRKLAALIHPYPIYSHAIRKAADQWLTNTILPTFIKSYEEKN